MIKLLKKSVALALIIPMFFSASLAENKIINHRPLSEPTLNLRGKIALGVTPLLGGVGVALATTYAYLNRKLQVVIVGGRRVEEQETLVADLSGGAMDAGCGRKVIDVISDLVVKGATNGGEGRIKPIKSSRAVADNWDIHFCSIGDIETPKLLRNAELIIVIVTDKNNADNIYDLINKNTKIPGYKKEGIGWKINCRCVIVQFVCEDKLEDVQRKIKDDTRMRMLSSQDAERSCADDYINVRADQEYYCADSLVRDGIDYRNDFHIFYWRQSANKIRYVGKNRA